MQRQALVAFVLVFLLVFAGCTNGSPDTSTPTPERTLASDDLSVHYINTGLGTSTLIEGLNETMLIDSGDWQDDGEYVIDYLEANDIDRIDHLVSTHPDSDHIGGQAAVIEYFEEEANGIGAVYDPGIPATSQTYERYLDTIEEYDVQLYETRADDELPFDDANVTVLAPPDPYLANEDPNENSIVLQVAHGDAEFLLPGDAAEAGEDFLVDEYGESMNVSALLAGHHGSKSSSSPAFLDVTTPPVAVISSPSESQYGHPDEDVLDRLADRSVATYWTATHGDIVMRSNSSAITVSTQQQASTDPESLRDGEPVAPELDEPVQERTVIDVSTGESRTPVATDGGTAPEATIDRSQRLSIAEIHAEAEGDDRDNRNDEYIVFENTGSDPIDLSGWTVSDDAGSTYSFPDDVSLTGGETVTLHTGSGTDSATDRYWESGHPVWNNAGDTVIVRDETDDVVIEEEYP